MKLQLAKNLNLTIIGKVTGKTYVFNGSGSVVDVDDDDAEIMKTKMSQQSCCSGGGPTPYFQVVEESLPSTRSETNVSSNRKSRRNSRSG